MISNRNCFGFSCRKVCSLLQLNFCLVESRQHKGLAQPPSTTVPRPGSPPAPPFRAVMAGEQESGAIWSPCPSWARSHAPSPAHNTGTHLCVPPACARGGVGHQVNRTVNTPWRFLIGLLCTPNRFTGNLEVGFAAQGMLSWEKNPHFSLSLFALWE